VIYDYCSMKIESRHARLQCVAQNTSPAWRFLTNHAQVLVCIAHDPGVRLREIGERVRITERAAHRIVVDLTAAGYITRQRNGRRNLYTINAQLPLPDPIAHEQNVAGLLEILTATHAPEPRVARRRTTA
jgi:MarR family